MILNWNWVWTELSLQPMHCAFIVSITARFWLHAVLSSVDTIPHSFQICLGVLFTRAGFALHGNGFTYGWLYPLCSTSDEWETRRLDNEVPHWVETGFDRRRHRIGFAPLLECFIRKRKNGMKRIRFVRYRANRRPTRYENYPNENGIVETEGQSPGVYLMEKQRGCACQDKILWPCPGIKCKKHSTCPGIRCGKPLGAARALR